MKVFVIFSLFVGIAFAADSWSRQLGNTDIDTLLQNRRLVGVYIRCLLEGKHCTPEFRKLKDTLPDALASGCSKCDEKTKETVEKVINHLKTERPNDWTKLLAKFDPRGEYEKRFQTKTA